VDYWWPHHKATDVRALWQCSPVVLKGVIRDFISEHTQQKPTLFLTTANANLETERKKNVTENIFIKRFVQTTPLRKDIFRKLILTQRSKFSPHSLDTRSSLQYL
jgi:hypothetical protein